jgi:hypothetical protein
MIDDPLQTMIDEVLLRLPKLSGSTVEPHRDRAHVKANQCLLPLLPCSTFPH